MASGIYLILYYFVGKNLKAFTIGVDRKAKLLASQTIILFTVDLSSCLCTVLSLVILDISPISYGDICFMQ